MKTTVFLLFLIMTNGLWAQNEKLHSCIEMGTNFAGFNQKIGYYGDSHSKYFDGSVRMGFNTGIKLKYDLLKNTQLGIDLLYVNTGSRYVSNKMYNLDIRESTELQGWESNENKSVKSYILNYVEIPIYLSLIKKVENNWESSLFGGMGLFVNMNSKLKHNYYYFIRIGPNMYVEEPAEDHYKCFFKPASRVNGSVFLGASFRFDEAFCGFNLKVEYLFSDIYQQPTMITEHVIPLDTGINYTYYGDLEEVESNMKTGLWMVSLSVFANISN